MSVCVRRRNQSSSDGLVKAQDIRDISLSISQYSRSPDMRTYEGKEHEKCGGRSDKRENEGESRSQ